MYIVEVVCWELGGLRSMAFMSRCRGCAFPVKGGVLANEDSQAKVQLRRKDLSWLFRNPMANRHPSKQELEIHHAEHTHTIC